MLKKTTFTISPVDSLKLDENYLKWQKRNGHLVCKIDCYKPLKETYCLQSIDYTLYVLRGSIKYQYLNDDIKDYDKEQSLEINAGESVFLPSGYYYYWVGSEGVDFVWVCDNPSKELWEVLKVENINIG